MSYVNGLSQPANTAPPVRSLPAISRNSSIFQAHLNYVPVRDVTTPAPAPSARTASDLPAASPGSALRQIFGGAAGLVTASADPARTAGAISVRGITSPAATAPASAAAPAVATTPAVSTSRDFDMAMDIASRSSVPTPLVKADGSLVWDAYTNNIIDPQQKAEMINRLTFNYQYAQAGAAGQRPPDNAVDNWGWDAYKTMQLRQQYGYTWVPNAHQNPVSIAPGLSAPGATPYNPAQGPGGSITVRTS